MSTSLPGNARDSLRYPWLSDFSAVPPALRRAARYVLQMLASRPLMHARLEDSDFLGVVWPLVRPLIDPKALARLEDEWHRPVEAAADADPPDDLPLPAGRRRGPRGIPRGAPGERMRDYLARRLSALPDTLFEILATADGTAPTHPSVAILSQCASLDDAETALLDLIEKKQTTAGFTLFLRCADSTGSDEHLACLGAALGMPVALLKPALGRFGALRRLQLVVVRRSQCDLEDFLDPGDLLKDILGAEPATEAELWTAITEPAPSAELRIADFPHLVRPAANLQASLSGAARGGKPGVNALFYGPAGVGKTQFAQAVADEAGLKAFRVRTADQDGDGLSRDGRLGAYQLAQRLLGERHDCVLIFDEVEDAFGHPGAGLRALLNDEVPPGEQKGWMNRLLEDNPVPAIWITNDAESMDPAFLRRFLLPVAFTTPPRSVRRGIAEHHLGGAGISEELLDELAADTALLPAQYGAARRLLDLQPGAEPEAVVREGVAASRRLLHGSAGPRLRQPVMDFDIAYLNLAGGIAPARLMEALAKSGRGSLCFFGPPGTGKTEFAQVLADALDRELVVRRCSDLVSPFVGLTERNLARMFAETDPERGVLFLDEVDSFLRDRRRAHRSWEVTEVNELLQQMECYPGIFIAATNLVENLDSAAMRRFDFKLQFRPLAPAQRRALLAREVLGDALLASELPAPAVRKLDQLDMLTPGDFANVVRQQGLLGETLSTEEFVRRLVAECRWKIVRAVEQQTG